MDDLRERMIAVNQPCYLMIDGTDRVDFPDLPAKMIDKALKELAKTHRLVKLDGGPHGTYSRYTNGRCRCDLCREANRERGRRYRKEVKERENEP